MPNFQPNGITFYKIKFCSQNGSTNNNDSLKKICEAKKVS